MPIFEYKCNDCKKTFEILLLPGQGGDVKCAGCGSKNLQKLISAPFLPSSVGKPANDDIRCCGSSPDQAGGKGCTPGSCCGKGSE
ncbi:MAG: zinc ribbon domain-containing protein [Firmicutes bacterium]|nr:zinc ribbon domain-containing protein [Bacillota bacterium]